MKLLYVYSKSTNSQDILWGFIELGMEIVANDRDNDPYAFGEALELETAGIINMIKKEKCDGVLSWNYHSSASIACEKMGVPYIAWLYDSPLLHVYSSTIYNNCNYIFSFDKKQYSELSSMGVKCYYLPLAVNTTRLGALEITDEEIKKYSEEVSFVGRLYTKNLYNEAMPVLSKDMITRHIAVLEKQYGNWKENYLYENITDEDLDILQKLAPIQDIENYELISKRNLYIGLIIARKMAEYERVRILNELAKNFSVTLYDSDDDTSSLVGVTCKPNVQYEEECPKVYFSSKINLNMTLRSIETGLPLRVFDIMGVGGFLMSNYQKEFEELFVPEKEVVLYSSMDELIDKTRFYLTHERERLIIAMNGYKRTLAEHTMKHRAAAILKTVYGLDV